MARCQVRGAHRLLDHGAVQERHQALQRLADVEADVGDLWPQQGFGVVDSGKFVTLCQLDNLNSRSDRW